MRQDHVLEAETLGRCVTRDCLILWGRGLKAGVDVLMTSGSQRVPHTCKLLPASVDYTPVTFSEERGVLQSKLQRSEMAKEFLVAKTGKRGWLVRLTPLKPAFATSFKNTFHRYWP